MIDAHRVTLSAPDDFDGWRDAARDLAEAGVPASAVVWQVQGGEPDLFGSAADQPAAAMQCRAISLSLHATSSVTAIPSGSHCSTHCFCG